MAQNALIGKLRQIASTPSTSCKGVANGTRCPKGRQAPAWWHLDAQLNL